MIAVAPDAKIWLNRTSASIGFGSREVLRSQERDGAFPEDELRAEKYDGVFMIDSTCMFVCTDDWEFDMAEILEYVWKETEVRMLAVVWVDTSEWAYEEMLSMIRESFDIPSPPGALFHGYPGPCSSRTCSRLHQHPGYENIPRM